MRPIILEVYSRFLVSSSDIDEREYAIPEDEIEAGLIHRNYISQKDVDVCIDFDINSLPVHQYPEAIQELHDALILKYYS